MTNTSDRLKKLASSLFIVCGDCELLFDECFTYVAEAKSFGGDLKPLRPTAPELGYADFAEWLETFRDQYPARWEYTFEAMVDVEQQGKEVLASAEILDNPNELGPNRFSVVVATDLAALGMALEIAALKWLNRDEPPQLLLQQIDEVHHRLGYITNCLYRARERAWQLQLASGMTPTPIIEELTIEQFPADQVARVRAALDQKGWDAKVDVVHRESRPLRRKRILDIRRALVAERSGNDGTAKTIVG
jgi:hypothetical protein